MSGVFEDCYSTDSDLHEVEHRKKSLMEKVLKEYGIKIEITYP